METSGLVQNSLAIEAHAHHKEYGLTDTIELEIVVRNRTSSAEKLRFESAQRFEILIFRAEDMVWRWSRDKLFAMATSILEIPPRKSIGYSVKVPALKLGLGSYDVIAIVTCDPPLYSECSLEVV